jgi:hypothetical protein
MEIQQIIKWMLAKLDKDQCLYQDDVVDKLVTTNSENLLRENADGNLVLGRKLLEAFKKETETTVVWVSSERYWRYRVLEDEPGREARG